MGKCSVDECERPVHARGYCSTCYARMYQSGELKRVRRAMRPRHRPVDEWFPTALVRTPGPMDTPCRVWPRQVSDRTGYGKMTVSGRTLSTHRLAWELENGPIPDGKLVLHKCDVKTCCNPDHLYVGTAADNTGDALRRGRICQGERSPNAKLTVSLVREARRRREQGASIRDICEALGTPYAAMYAAIKRRTWRHVQ